MAGESDRSQLHDDLNPSKGPRSCRIKSSVDRISALPESVLVHILSFLPIEDAIKTEVLSKRWQYLWTCVPALLFRFRPSHSFDKNCDFVTFVDKTLVRCNGSRVQKFGVDFEYEPRFASNVNLWTRFAARNGTEELHLELHRSAIEDWEMLQDSEFYVLPQLLYTNSLFRELRFSFCGVMPKGVVDWKWLKKLSIGYAKLSDDVIQKILAGSPVLEIVELFCFYGINRLHISNASVKRLILREFWDIDGEPDSLFEISAPNLQSLEFSGHLERKNYRLGDVSSLVDATLDCFLLSYPEDYDDDHEIHRNTLRGLLESLVHVKNLTFGAWAIQILSIMETKGLRPLLLKCECLTLDMCLTKVELPGIASVLESSPSLETLVITMSPFSNIEILWEKPIRLCNFDEEHYWTSQKRTFNCLMLHLKIVKFAGLRFSDFMFSFVQFLLSNARVLQKIVINTPRKDSKTAKELFQAAQKLLSFPRSSPDAVVMFYE